MTDALYLLALACIFCLVFGIGSWLFDKVCNALGAWNDYCASVTDWIEDEWR